MDYTTAQTNTHINIYIYISNQKFLGRRKNKSLGLTSKLRDFNYDSQNLITLIFCIQRKKKLKEERSKEILYLNHSIVVHVVHLKRISLKIN